MIFPHHTRTGVAYLTAGLLFLGMAVAQAATLITYDFTGSGGFDETTPWTNTSTIDPNLSPIGSGTTGFIGAGGGSSLTAGGSTADYQLTDGTATSLSDAVTSDKYMRFTVQAAPGYELDLSDLTLTLTPGTFISGGSNRMNNAALYTSETGYSELDVLSTSGPTGSGNTAFSFSLSNETALSGLTGPVEMRVYLWNSGGTPGAAAGWTFDSATPGTATLIGDISLIPEPSVAGLLGLSLLVFAGKRRHHTNAG